MTLTRTATLPRPATTLPRPATTVTRTAGPDLGWTLAIIRGCAYHHKHLPRLEAAAHAAQELPLGDSRFALTYAEAVDLIWQHLD